MKKPLKKNGDQPKRLSKLDLIVAETREMNAHLSTEDLARKRAVLTCKHAAVEDELKSVAARLIEAKAQRAVLEAQLNGLSIVISLR